MQLTTTHGYQYDPLIPKQQPPRPLQNKHEVWFFNKVHGIHMWQIFTAMALILAVASSLIYVNRIVPQNKNEEFINITKAKTTFYNQNEYNQSYFNQNYNKNLVGFQLSSSCYSDVSTISSDTTSLETNLSDLNEQQRYLTALISNYENQDRSSDYSKLLGDYAQSSQRYLTEVILMFQKQDIYRKKTIEIFQKATLICSGDVATIKPSLKEFDTLLNQFPVSSLDTMNSWVGESRQWSETTKKLIDAINASDYINPQQIAELVQEFKTLYIAMFSVAFDYGTYKQKIEGLYDNSINILRKVEKFEQSYVLKHKVVKGNTVFVTIKEER